jgi:transposase
MEPVCPGCRERDVLLAALQEQVARLQRRLDQLEAELRQLRGGPQANSTNSSVPPSANPLNAPPPPKKAPTGRKPGGQPGHAYHARPRLPADETKHYVPTACGHCHAALPRTVADELAPRWHQVVELPRKLAVVVEHQTHARTCPCCGSVTWATLPPAVAVAGYGPRFTALVSYLSGSQHVSKRGIEEILETVCGVPVALGTVSNLEQQTSAALAPVHAEAKAAVQQAAVKNVDETSWREAGQLRWLWTAATRYLAVFVVYPGRGLAGLAALLGTTVTGIVCSDRWSAYQRLPVELRQLCWAHLKRDFQKCKERAGSVAEDVGGIGLDVVADLFTLWHRFRGGSIDRGALQAGLQPLRETLHEVLEAGAGCAAADTALASFCRNLLELEPALWTFAVEEGVEPTNNHAERVLRRGVLWRKNAFGCHSARGCVFVERILTTIQSLRLQQRPVLDFLEAALVAYRADLPAPRLVPTT